MSDHALCVALLRDEAEPVREQAAWAMEWETGATGERVACLATAAARDPSGRVRQRGALSLTRLALDDNFARSALLHLTSEDYESNVRDVALRWIGSHGDGVATVRLPDRPQG
jgi:hypothetical protein